MSTPEWTPPTQAQLSAADEIVAVIVEALRSARGVHAETAIGVLDARIGFALAAQGFVEGSKTMPVAAGARSP